MTDPGDTPPASQPKQVVYALPPRASLMLQDPAYGPSGVLMPFWVYWAELAGREAATAESLELTDDEIDAIGVSFAAAKSAPSVPSPTSADTAQPAAANPDERATGRGSVDGLFAGMVAVAASAHALDAFYGTVKPMVKPPPFHGAKRARQILETLKRGFAVGPHVRRWQGEIDWLFGARDLLLHHSEEYRALVVNRVTERTVVASGLEAFQVSPASARRAADFATEVIRTCLTHPRPALREWAEDRRAGLAGSLFT